MICHVEASADFDVEPTIVTALCGAQCVIFEDGAPTPADFDFVLPRDAHLADCAACLAEEVRRHLLARAVVAT